MSNPTPAALAALDPDRIRTLATTYKAVHAAKVAEFKASGVSDRFVQLESECSKAYDDFRCATGPDVILALLAAARHGEEDTTLTAVRAWFDAWADWPTTMSRDEAARLPEWDAMIDALGYDRDERRSAARAASQQEEVSRG